MSSWLWHGSFCHGGADKAGWGDWAGPGMTGVSAKVVKKRQILLKDMEDQTSRLRAGRTDSRLANVILSERRIKTASKFKISDIPHPFTSREEYERSLQMPLGGIIMTLCLLLK